MVSDDRVAAGTERPAPPSPGPARRPCRTARALRLAAAGWLLLVAAQYALSGRWWLWLLVDTIPPFFFLLVPVALLAAAVVLALRTARTRMFVACWIAAPAAVAGILGAPYTGINLAALGGAGDGPIRPHSIRIFDWNTTGWGKETTLSQLHSKITSVSADVYLFQEYLHESANDNVITQINDLAWVKRAFPGFYIATVGDLLTISRFPIVATPAVGPAVTLGPHPAWYQQFLYAKVLRTDLRINSQIISVYNVHIPEYMPLGLNPLTPAFYRFLHYRYNIREQELGGLTADIKKNRNPIIVAGDFNTSPANADIDSVRALLPDAISSNDSLYPTSWTTRWIPFWRIDWAFASPQIDVERQQYLNADGMADHRPQLLIVYIRTGKS